MFAGANSVCEMEAPSHTEIMDSVEDILIRNISSGNLNDFDENVISNSSITFNENSSDDSEETIEGEVVKDIRHGILERIEELVLNLLTNLKNGYPPTFTFFNRRTWGNVSFDKKIIKGSGNICTTLNFNHPSSQRHIALIFHLLSQIYNLNINRSSSTKRELFYQCLGTLKSLQYHPSQNIVDNAMQDVGMLLNFPPRILGILPSSHGLVAGQLSVSSSNMSEETCNSTIILDTHSSLNECFPIPGEIASLSSNNLIVKSKAQFIIIVEKDAAFQKLVESGALKRFNPCIILTGRGYPDTATRRLVHLIWKSLDVPILALVDGDPHGIEIMCVYRFGSLAMSKDTEDLVVPAIRWLGLHPTDMASLGLPLDSMAPLGNDGILKLESLLKRPYIMSNPSLYKQVETLLKYNHKVEIEALCSLSPTYLTDVYIPGKIASDEAI